MAGPGTERRATPRLRLPLEVVVDGAATSLYDLSAGGVAVVGDGFAAPGSVVELTLPLPDRAPPLVARGLVVRREDGRTACRLEALTPDERQRVDRFVLGLTRLRPAGR